jgi:signal transduction histidine kinase
LQFSLTFLVLGTVVVVLIYSVSATTTTIDVTRATPNRNGGVTFTPAGGSGFFIVPTAPAAPTVRTTVTATGTATRRQVSRAQPSTSPIHEVLVSQHNADLARLLVTSWVALAITALLSGLLGWLGAGRVLRPLWAMTDKARTISAGNLGDRLALSGPDDEFKQLGDTFDELLARLEGSFDAQRRFVANASHELRTPLTLDRTLLQLALSDPEADVAAFRATCEELLASSRDQEQLLEGLLTLAVSERGLRQREPVALEELAGRVGARFASEAESHEITLELDLAEARTSGDPALIERLIANLVDNAIDYNHPGGHVGVQTATRDGRAVMTVSNTGPQIVPGLEGALFEPFRRFGETRGAGEGGHHGLGLSIVRAIAISHDASISTVPAVEGGLVITVSFPGG